MSMHLVALFLVWYLVFVFSTTCHEAAHAWMARRGGDSTAYSLGHVTLDPLPHIRREPFGMVIIPILSFFVLSRGAGLIGWASVPYDAAWGSRYPRRWALMSLVGPLTNFLLAAIAVVAIHALTAANVFQPFGFGGERVGFVQLPAGHEFNSPLGALGLGLSIMLQLNLLLGFFNLIPIPPLDGAAVVEGFSPPPVRAFYERFRANSMLQILAMLVVWTMFPSVVYPLIDLVLSVVI